MILLLEPGATEPRTVFLVRTAAKLVSKIRAYYTGLANAESDARRRQDSIEQCEALLQSLANENLTSPGARLVAADWLLVVETYTGDVSHLYREAS